ncbi:Cytochrome P450 CYP82J17 [Linum perenne]
MIAISGVALLLTLVLVHNLRRNIREGPNSAPEPPGVLPIIGHLHLIARSRLPLTQTLADFCDQHGPVVSLWLGAYRTIIVCHPDVIKECLTTNDKVLAARPPSSVGKYITYNYASIGFAPDGPYHQWLRKIVATKLLSPQRLKYLKHVQVSEVNSMIKQLYSLCKVLNGTAERVLMGDYMEHLSMNLISRLIAGKRYFGGEGKGKELGKLMKEFARVVGVLVPSDLIPALGWTNFLPGPVRYLKRVAREFDAVMQRWIEEHESMSEVGDESYKNDESRGQGFIDVMLSVSKDDFSTFGHSVHTIIKSNAMTLLTARAETTRITLIWIISNLLNNKRALKLVQEELDSIVGRERWVDDSDIEKLVYLQAVIKETMRLYPAGPLAAPHVATKDCLIAGHHVPKGTRVLLNLWKMQRDPVVWSNPNEFIPERFLEEKAHLDPLG